VSDCSQLNLPQQLQTIISMVPGGWGIFNALFGDCSRPYSQYVCSTTVCVCALIGYLGVHETLGITAITLCAGLAGGNSYLRSQDKKTAAGAASTDKKTAAIAANPGELS